jgi:itaconyl-CoA hydratase
MPEEGPFFEDFHQGDLIRHPLGRTISEADNTWFTLLTCNTNPVHFNKDYTEKTFPGAPFHGRLLVNVTLTLATIVGLSVEQTSKNGITLQFNDVKAPNPTFPGDTIYAESRVISVRESKSRPEMGVVEIASRGYKPEGTTVMEFRRTIMVRKRGATWTGAKMKSGK